MEAWYEWQTGQDRQLETKSQSGDLIVIFPPINVVQVLPRGVYTVLPLMSLLEVFYIIITAFICIDLERGPYQTLNKNQ